MHCVRSLQGHCAPRVKSPAICAGRLMSNSSAQVSQRAYEASLRASTELLKDADRKHTHILAALQTLFVHVGLQPPVAVTTAWDVRGTQPSAISPRQGSTIELAGPSPMKKTKTVRVRRDRARLHFGPRLGRLGFWAF